MAIETDDTISDSCFAELLKLTHKLTGITIGENRRSMLVSRLRKRLRANTVSDFDSYVKILRTEPAEAQHFVNCVTTNETYFFRTPRIWAYLKTEFIPQWIGANQSKPLRAWSAAASTGEEAHTLGVVLESFRKKHKGFDYKITGTDISSRVIDVAKEGRYNGRSIERFRQTEGDLFQAHMIGNDKEGFQAAPEIRERIEFKTHNLFENLRQAGQFDVIFLRNVLIYFSKVDQERVLGNIQKVLKPGGALLIGESETLSQIQTDFTSVSPLIYRLPAQNGVAA